MKFNIFNYLAGFLTALIIAYIRYLLTKSHTTETSKRNRKQAACDNFTNAIACKVADLSNDDLFSSANISNPKKLHAAMTQFKSSISNDQRTHLTNIWDNYTYHNKNTQPVFGTSNKNNVIKTLNELLSFVEEQSP